MYVVAAEYYAKEGKDDEIAASPQTMNPISGTEPGCALYTVNRSLEDPRKFLLYEQYHDRAGYYDAHMTPEPFKENIFGKVVLMQETRVRDFYDVLQPA
ncbi:MAG: antibiotic biosynthesis monooxygenase family protein [Terriglobia bacterium]